MAGLRVICLSKDKQKPETRLKSARDSAWKSPGIGRKSAGQEKIKN
jgi:hypothetical protein